MKHMKTIATPALRDTLQTGGCGECRASCQSACKTSCTVGNQSCEKQAEKEIIGREDKANRSFEK